MKLMDVVRQRMRNLPVMKLLGILAAMLFALSTTGCGDSGASGSASSGSSGITVTPVGVKSVTLNWTAPTEKANGDILTMNELAGYQIVYGTSNDPFANVIAINQPYASNHTIDGLPAGDYTFRISAYDNMGRISTYSNSISKVIS